MGLTRSEKDLIKEMDATVRAMNREIERARRSGDTESARQFAEHRQRQITERGIMVARVNAN